MSAPGTTKMKLWKNQSSKHIINLPGEAWRKIYGVSKLYTASNKGRIKREAIIDSRGHHQKARILKQGEFTIDGVWYSRAGLILRAFIGPPPKGREVSRHLNDIRTNNCIENLAWGTQHDNIQDALRNGRTYISRGHLGHPHSEETKARLRVLSSRPHGRKMTTAHKAAIWAGYRKKFPEKEKPPRKPCACGCKQLAASGSSFIWGHAGRLRFLKINQSRIGKPRSW